MALESFLQGFAQQQLSPTGYLGGKLEDEQIRRKNKLELALQSKKLEQEMAAKSVPYEQLQPTLDYMSGKPANLSGVMHPTAQTALFGASRPLMAVNARESAATSRQKQKMLLSQMSDEGVVSAILKNPELFDKLPGNKAWNILPQLAAGGFMYLGKPLSEGLQNRAIASNSGLRAADRVNLKINKDPSNFVNLYIKGIGAKELEGDLMEISDVITRIRTGAALNKDEQTFYRSLVVSDNLSTLIDDFRDGDLDANTLKYRLNTIIVPYFKEMSEVRNVRKTATVMPQPQAGESSVPQGALPQDDTPSPEEEAALKLLRKPR